MTNEINIGSKLKKHVLVPAGYAILKDGNKILMSRRFQTGYEDGKYSFPAGHVDFGETFTDCCVRELKEEIGVEIDKKDLQLCHIMQRYSSGSAKENRIDVFYFIEKWGGEIKNLEPEKCDDLSWFEMDNLPTNTIPYIKKLFENIKNGILFSEYDNN